MRCYVTSRVTRVPIAHNSVLLLNTRTINKTWPGGDSTTSTEVVLGTIELNDSSRTSMDTHTSAEWSGPSGLDTHLNCIGRFLKRYQHISVASTGRITRPILEVEMMKKKKEPPVIATAWHICSPIEGSYLHEHFNGHLGYVKVRRTKVGPLVHRSTSVYNKQNDTHDLYSRQAIYSASTNISLTCTIHPSFFFKIVPQSAAEVWR